ncbi:hypothetical protein HY495_00970 [Candidatus Woesearchaeota archaeon]|nr:hypothetical protein [Candidatus Woesearchaeota archaeon]
MNPKQKLTLAAIIAAVGLGGGWFAKEYGDEYYLATPTEQAVEQKIGRQIFLSWDDEGIARDEKARLVETLYVETRQHWDYFDRQWEYISSVEVLDELENKRALGRFRKSGILELKSTLDKRDGSMLVHELAHAWHRSLSRSEEDDFKVRWLAISNNAYHFWPIEKAVDQTQSCQRYLREAATVDCYGARNFREDVATIVETVYSLATTEEKVITASKRSKEYAYFDAVLHEMDSEIVERVIKKIHLAAEFGFYSPAEEMNAVEICRYLIDKAHFTRTRNPP